LDLLEKMLAYDPLRRVTTEEGLQHSYFKSSPRPTPPEKLPKAARNPVDLKSRYAGEISHLGSGQKRKLEGKQNPLLTQEDDLSSKKIAKRLFV
jgi:cyclin-dependent kinase 7